MIEQASLIIGDGNWAVKSDSLLGYALPQGKYVPREMDVVRATTGTRVNEAGLVELVPYNLFTYSQTFSNSDWTKGDTTVTGGQTGYDGSSNAFLLNENNANATHIIRQTPIVGGQYTISVYAKANTRNWVWLRGVQSSTNVRAWFNLSTGVVGIVETNGTATIENVGNGWYRCSLTIADFQSSYESYIGIANANGTETYLGNGSSIYIQNAQGNEGTIKPYLPTTTRLNIPRIDYSTGSAALLVERQRTNVLTYSSSFDNGDWSKLNVSVTANSVTSPSGIQDADTLIENTANDQHVIYRAITGTSNTFSFYAKPNGRNWVAVLSNNGDYSFFNIANGTLGTIAATSTATIEDAGNGWYRCTVYNTHPTFGAVINLATANGVVTYTGNGTSGAYIWGSQLEAASYATSYIPTTSASVTRNADVISKTGLSNFIGQTQGAVFVDINIDLSYTQADMRFINVSDGTTANWYFIGTNNANEFRFFYRSGATTYVTITTPLTSGHHKLAFAYASNDYVAYVDGVQINNTTTLSVGSTSQIDVGNSFGSNLSKQFIKSAAIFKNRLTNSELASLTSL